MRKLIFVAVCVLGAAAGTLRAQDKDPQLENIKSLRLSLLTKMPVVVDLFDNEHNGLNPAYNVVAKQYTDGIAAVNKAIETENAKPADARDKATLDALTAKSAKFQALWADERNTWAIAWAQKVNTLTATRQNLVQVVNDLTNLDQPWLRADCDRALLVAIFTELNKRVDEMKEQVIALNAEYMKRVTDDGHTFQE